MSDLTAAALVVLGRQHNVISVAQLMGSGVGAKPRRRLVRDGVLEYVGHSVLRVPGPITSMAERLVAVCLQHPRGYITGPTGGSLLNVRRMPRISKIHFCVAHGSRIPNMPGVQLRQTTCLGEHHRRVLDDGIVVASWPRLAFDLAADLGPLDLASVIDQILHDGHCQLEELGAIARELCARGRAGSRLFAATLLRRGGRPAVDSHPELRVLDGLQRRGVPVEPQVRHLALPNGSSVRIDMAVETARWAVEVDVHPHHLGLPGTTRDKRRDRQLHLIGWQVERVTPLDLLDLRGLLDELVELYRRRVAAVAL